MRIALFGGRFDPPHNGHLGIITEVLSSDHNIDQVWLLPAKNHPWKPMHASDQHRLTMIRLLETPKIKVHDIDFRREGEIYTIDTITLLKKQYDHEFFWICGADTLADLPRWKDYELLLQTIRFMVFPRTGYSLDYSYSNMVVNPMLSTQISSLSATQIRKMLNEKAGIAGLLPKKVALYIKENKLYI